MENMDQNPKVHAEPISSPRITPGSPPNPPNVESQTVAGTQTGSSVLQHLVEHKFEVATLTLTGVNTGLTVRSTLLAGEAEKREIKEAKLSESKAFLERIEKIDNESYTLDTARLDCAELGIPSEDFVARLQRMGRLDPHRIYKVSAENQLLVSKEVINKDVTSVGMNVVSEVKPIPISETELLQAAEPSTQIAQSLAVPIETQVKKKRKTSSRSGMASMSETVISKCKDNKANKSVEQTQDVAESPEREFYMLELDQKQNSSPSGLCNNPGPGSRSFLILAAAFFVLTGVSSYLFFNFRSLRLREKERTLILENNLVIQKEKQEKNSMLNNKLVIILTKYSRKELPLSKTKSLLKQDCNLSEDTILEILRNF